MFKGNLVQYLKVIYFQKKEEEKGSKSFDTCNAGGHETRNAASDQSSDATPGDVGLSTWSKVCWKKTTGGSQSWIDSFKKQASCDRIPLTHASKRDAHGSKIGKSTQRVGCNHFRVNLQKEMITIKSVAKTGTKKRCS